jgi:hypothetical protein
MAAPVVLSSQVPPGDLISKDFERQANKPLRRARLHGEGDARVLVSTDAITSGTVANLTTLFATQVAAGLALFPPSSVSMVKVRAIGRGTAATIFQWIEMQVPVMMNTTTPLLGTAAALHSSNIGGGTLATVIVSLSSNDVTVQLTGSATAMQWVIDISIDDGPGAVTAGA